MLQSMSQQPTRQYVCYAAYVGVSPDHPWRFISFPSYTKSAYSGGYTTLTYIDLNIGDSLATNGGGNAVQGSVSFTEEDDDN